MITIIWNNRYDITDLSSGLEWYTSDEGQPGKVTFDLMKNSQLKPSDGDIIDVRLNGKGIFLGRIFKAKFRSNLWNITAYDKLRYLKSEDTMVFNASSLDKRFEAIMKTMSLPYKVLDRSSFNCAAQIADIKTYYTMLNEAIIETRDEGNISFGIRDNYGTIELFKHSRFETKTIIGDGSLVDDSGFEYELSIEDSANIVKLVLTEDDKTRTLRTETNQANINRWGGKLQITQQVDEADSNQAKLVSKTKDLLKKHGKAEETIKFSKLIGDSSFRAGITTTIQLEDINKNVKAIVTECIHTFDKVHQMSLEVRLL